MQQVQHQMMGYDRAITMFSPDGRLLQVEYAKKTVKQGSTAIGIVCKDGVVLIADKRIVDPFTIPESVEKIFQIDDHIAVTFSGIAPDARVLVEKGQLKAQQHQVTYDTQIDVDEIVKDICSLKQICTQSGGLRPFGVSLLITGVDQKGPKLFETDPVGIFFPLKAAAIGEAEAEVEEILKKEYKDSITIEEGIKLGIKALTKVLDGKFGPERVAVAYIKTEDKNFKQLTKKEIEKVFSSQKKKK